MIKIFNLETSEMKSEIFARQSDVFDVTKTVTDIINDVRINKDDALFKYCELFDKVKLNSFEVSEEETKQALKLVDKKFIDVIKKASENIYNYHKRQVRNSFFINDKDGVILGQKITPLQRVGIYVPGGTASYPSTVLMNCIPAKIAGVKEIVMVTPPRQDKTVNPYILAAAHLCGISKIYKVGGAQAIAALSYGTQTIPKVDKIVGPGNAFVAEAKKQVFGIVDIDMIAGPSEILIIGDKTCNAKFLAADMLSQAEHDKLASAVLITDSVQLAKDVREQIEKQITGLEREEIARVSIDNYGKIIVVDSILKAIELSNDIAPEHLELCVDNPFDLLDKVVNAGSIFLGKYCPEALGDYYAGPNHTLPTGGTAKFSSPLSVDDFIKKSSVTYYTKAALNRVSEDIDYFAKKEGLTAHAKSVTVRFED